MPKRKGRGGRLKRSNAGKKPVKVDDKLDILAKQSEMVEVEEVEEGSGFEEEQEADIGTMPKRTRFGQLRRPRVLKEFQESSDGNLDILTNPSNSVEAGFGSGEEHVADVGNAPMRNGPGPSRPRGAPVRKMFDESDYGNLDNLISNIVENVLSREEKQTGNTYLRKGRGRPKASASLKNCQKSANDNLDVLTVPSNLVEIGTGYEGEKQTGNTYLRKGRGRPKASASLKNCQNSANDNLDVLTVPSNLVEIGTGFEGEQQTGTDASATSMKRGRGRPKGSTSKRKLQESAVGNLGGMIDPSNLAVVSPGPEDLEEKQEDVITTNYLQQNTYTTPERRGPGRPRGSTAQLIAQQNADDFSMPKKRGRGPTRGLTLEMKRQQSADGKLDVLIHPTKMVAVGPGRKDFITDLSVIVRQNARHNVSKWKRVPQSVRDTIVQKILDNWRLPDTVFVRKAIIDEAGRLYRNWRNRLHNYYTTFPTKEEALKHVPDDINSADWKTLVDYFSSPSFEAMSAKNKLNKAKQTVNHSCGPKSFQAVSYEARDAVTGKEPDLHQLWELTHKRANGEWVDEASKEIHEKVTQQIVEKLNEIDDSGNEAAEIEPEIIESAFKSLVGKKSHMLSINEGSSFRVHARQLQAELDAQKRETEEAKRKCNEARAKLAEVESQLSEERRKREEAEARLQDRQIEMHAISTQVQTAIQAALSQHKLPSTEAESSRTNKKMKELEAQLHEAEDVITDLRAELRRFGMR